MSALTKQINDYRIRYDRPCYKCGSNYCPADCDEPLHLQQPRPKQELLNGKLKEYQFGENMSALTKQINGNHYKDKAIQPIQYILANNLGYCEANVVKYVSRWKDKNGLQDLYKAKHYLELLIELEKKNENKPV